MLSIEEALEQILSQVNILEAEDSPILNILVVICPPKMSPVSC